MTSVQGHKWGEDWEQFIRNRNKVWQRVEQYAHLPKIHDHGYGHTAYKVPDELFNKLTPEELVVLCDHGRHAPFGGRIENGLVKVHED